MHVTNVYVQCSYQVFIFLSLLAISHMFIWNRLCYQVFCPSSFLLIQISRTPEGINNDLRIRKLYFSDQRSLLLGNSKIHTLTVTRMSNGILKMNSSYLISKRSISPWHRSGLQNLLSGRCRAP